VPGTAFDQNVTIAGKVTDQTSPVVRFQDQVDHGGLSDATFESSGSFQYTTSLPLDGSADGLRTVDFVATDIAGNVSNPVPLTLMLDTCGFLHGLSGWTTVQTGGTDTGKGGVTLAPDDDGDNGALLREGNSFNVTLSKTFTVPQIPGKLEFEYSDLNFDTTAQNMIKDAFEVALVDASGRPLVQPFAPNRDAFFNIAEAVPAVGGSGTAIDGQTVTLDLSGVTPGTQATLIFRLVNNDTDHGTSVKVTCARLPAGAAVVAPTTSPTDQASAIAPLPATGAAATPLVVAPAASPAPAAISTGAGITVYSPVEHNEAPAGTAVVVEGRAVATPPSSRAGDAIVDVTLNGMPVDVLDAEGNFFARVTLAPGQNVLHFASTDSLGQPGSTTLVLTGLTQPASQVDFSSLSDISASFQPGYARTSFEDGTSTLYSDVAIHNAGQYPVDAPLYVGITNISNPKVRVLSAAGTAPAGVPYVDFTGLVTGGRLSPGGTTGQLNLAFSNPDRGQFTYDLGFFGVINRAAEFTSVPVIAASAGRTYTYGSAATDPDNDPLRFSLPIAPDGMQIDPATGRITWSPTAADLGNHDVTLHVEDGRGGFAEQHYVVSVTNPLPNRPPYFTSVPIVDAIANTDYTYQATATDPDGDSLTYALNSGPPGMLIDPVTGLVQWTPTAESSSHTWNAAEDFSVASNPGGDWSYGWSSSLGSTLHLYPEHEHPFGLALDSWVDPAIVQAGAPTVYHNGTLNSISGINSVLNWQPGQLTFHPGALGQYSVVRWTAPAAGTIRIATTFTGNDTTTTDVHILDNGRVLFNGLVNGLHDSTSFSATEIVAARDTIDFTVGVGTNGSFYNDTTTLDASITLAALPSNVVPVTLVVSDGRGGTATQSFTIVVRPEPGNHPPVIISQPVATAAAGQTYTYPVKAIDPDGDPLTYSLSTKPDGMTIDPTSGHISWVAQVSDVGSHGVTVEVEDGRGGFDTQSFTIDVSDDRPPEISRVYDKTVEAGTNLQFTLGNPGLHAGELLVGNVTLPVAQIKAIDPATGIQSLIFEQMSRPAGPGEGLKPNFRPNSLILDNEGYIITNSPISGVDFALYYSGVRLNPANGTYTEPPFYRVFAHLPDGDYLVQQQSDSGIDEYNLVTGFVRHVSDYVINGPGGGGYMAHDRRGYLFIDDESNVYFTDSTGLSRLNLLSGLVTLVDPIDPKSVNNASGVASEDESHLIVTASGPQAGTGSGPDGEVFRVDITTGQRELIADGGLLIDPWGVTIAEDGMIYVADTNGRDAIGELTSSVIAIDPVSYQQRLVSADQAVDVVNRNAFRPLFAVSHFAADGGFDPDGDPLSFSMENLPEGATFDPATKTFQWTPRTDQGGDFQVIARVSDGRGGFDSTTFLIHVVNGTTPPAVNHGPDPKKRRQSVRRRLT
jgi:hypothetical protein